MDDSSVDVARLCSVTDPFIRIESNDSPIVNNTWKLDGATTGRYLLLYHGTQTLQPLGIPPEIQPLANSQPNARQTNDVFERLNNMLMALPPSNKSDIQGKGKATAGTSTDLATHGHHMMRPPVLSRLKTCLPCIQTDIVGVADTSTRMTGQCNVRVML